MEKHSTKEKSISTEDILEALDRFGARSKTPSPIQDQGDTHNTGSSEIPQLSLLIDDPLNAQRLSVISADGSEVDSDYSSASSVVHVSDGQRNLEREWQMLFGSTAYYSKIRQHALEGKLRFSKFRSICWKVFLECLPEQKEEWVAKSTQLRNDYQELKTKHFFDPNKTKNRALDLSVFNPLSQDENSPWKQYFQDNELKSTIKQDLDRLFPEIEFFQLSRVKDMMLSILFCHAKKNEALSYKQGMHELLAPIVYVLNEDSKLSEHLEGSSLNIARFLMDPNYIEEDAFAMFVQLMDQTETWYLQLPSQGVPERNKFLDPHAEPFTDQDTLPCTAIVKKLNRIHEHMLRKYDPELWVHFKNLDITPQVYGLRWIRLLFGREFSVDEVLVLWDALFADGPMLDLVDYIYISMLDSIRDKLLVGSYLVCMGYLMKFPRVYDDVHRYVRRALALRQSKISSASRSSPRPSRPSAPDSSGTLAERKKQGVKRPQSAFTSFTKRYQQFMEPTKQIAARATSKLPATETPRTNSFTEEELVSKGVRPARPVSVPAQETRDRADSGPHSSTPVKAMKSIANPLRGKLMTRPRTRSKVDYDELAQDHERLQQQVSSLKSELDKIQGLYLYCGRKMDSYIDLLQDELANEEGVNDVVYLCLAGLKQVRDLLKGTLAFRGSTMEHECDFMEIDNNIASRLQVPSLRHQMHLENLPDGIPVPMLANFGHFENPSEENESSFMTGKVDQKESGDCSGGFAGLKGELNCLNEEDRNDKISVSTLKHNAQVSETIAVEGDSFEKRASNEYKSEDNHLKNSLREHFRTFDEESWRSSRVPVDSNSNREGTQDSFNDNHAVPSIVEHKTDKEPVQPDDDSQLPAFVHGEERLRQDDREMSTVSDPLTKLRADFDLKVQLQSSDSGCSSYSQGRCRPEVESPERDFVFVNCDGTAMSLPKPPRHPLDNNQDDEFEENNPW